MLNAIRRPQQIRILVSGLRQLHITNWHESDVIVDRKSRFQARHTELKDPALVPEIISLFLAQHRSIAKNASHPHIYAWRTGDEVEETGPKKKVTKRFVNIQQGFSDNGEKGAGSRLLEQLALQNVINKLVIVTRWYGGNPIGSLRFRHISSCSFNSLRKVDGKTHKY